MKPCEYCDGAERNMDVVGGGGMMKISKNKYSPSGYLLIADNSYNEYPEISCPIWNCPICGRSFTEEL